MPSDLPTVPPTLRAERAEGGVAVLTLARPHKRNAIDDTTLLGIEHFFRTVPDDVDAVVLDADGDHFCAGLDLGEMVERDLLSGIAHSQMWHRAFEAVESGRVPVVAALHGAVVGGGLELAAACHLRVADESTFYALPEATRGLFLGGGGSVRIPHLIGVPRMVDLMLTGRRYDAEEGHAAGLSQYLVPADTARKTALELAARVAENASQSTFAVLQALPRTAGLNPRDGLFLESLVAAIAQSTEDAKGRMRDFLEGKAARAGER